MPLKVSITVKVEDGNYSTPVEVTQARTITVPEGGYQDPQPKGFPEARNVLQVLAREVTEVADRAIMEASEFDRHRVDRESAKLEAK